jgi:folate-binding protein YgfZ
MTVTLPQTRQDTPSISKDVREQFAALLSSCGLFDLRSRAKIILTGEDRVRWLNGMVTNNIRDLAPGHGVYAFLLNPQGHILGDLDAFHRGDYVVIDTDESQFEKIRATFDHYIIMDDVEVTDARNRLAALGVAGPQAREVLTKAGIEVPELAPLQLADLTWQESVITLLRSDAATGDSYEIWAAPETVAKLENELLAAGATLISPAALELHRIARGIPSYGHDIRERDLPQETGQERALHFTKGCYVGQEIVERIRSRGGVHRTFTGFAVDGTLPTPGTKIQSEGKDVGEITSAAALPFASGDKPVALGYIRKEAINKSLTAGDARLTAASLPFVNS